MSKYDLMKNVAKKNSAKTTADSSKSVSKPQTQTTAPAKTSTKKSEATYWQASQQTSNKQATKSVQKQMNISQPAKKTLSQSEKRRAQADATIARNKYKEDTKKAQTYNPNEQADYSQFNEGVKNLFNAGSAMRKYADANRKTLETERYRRLGQAERAQAVIDRDRADINSNRDVKAWSDLGLSTLGGLTSGIGGQIRAGSNLVQGIAGITGNQDLARAALRFDENLGVDQALRNVNEGNMVANNLVGKAAQSIGNMIPTIAGNIMSGGSEALGLGVMGSSVFGNSGSEAFRNLSADGDLSRADAARALGYGAGSAGLEIGTEMLSSIFPGLDTFAFTNPNHLLGQAGGEALEEMVSSTLEPLINPLANADVQNTQQYGQDIYNNTFGDARNWGRDIAESGLLGAATSLAMGAPANIQNAMLPENRLGRGLERMVNTETPQMTTPSQEENTGYEETPPEASETTFKFDRAQDTYNKEFGEFMEDTLANSEMEEAEELEPEERTLTKRQQKDVAEEYRTSEIKPASETVQVGDETYYAQASDEDTISDGEYRESDEGLSDDDDDYDEIEYVPTGDTDTDAVGRLKAATKADPSNTTRIAETFDEGVDEVLADTSLPEEVTNQIKGGLKINQTAQRIADGDALGYLNETIPETDAPEYKAKIDRRTADVAYLTTKLEPTKGVAQQMNDKAGDFKKVFEELTTPKTGALNAAADFADRLGKAVKGQFGIQTDYDDVVYTARVLDCKERIGKEMVRLTDQVKSKGYEVEIVPTITGDKTVRVTKDGKAVTPSELEGTIKELTEVANMNDDIILKATNIGHNVATILRMFRTDLLTPAGQLKSVTQEIDNINKQMDKKFKRKIKSGELSHVTLNDDLAKQFLEADDDATRAALMEQMGADIASQVPPTFMEKLDAFRYNNLLFNGLTWIRNGVGNGTQSQMANAKNIALYAIESVAKARGLVRYNHLDMTADGDRAILNHTSENVANTLMNDFTDAKNSGNAKKYLKSLGYDGALLNTLQHYKGKAFNFSQIDYALNRRLIEKVANNAKDAGYTVNEGKLLDKNGNAVSEEAYRKLLNESFKQAKKQWLSSDDLRQAKVNGAGKGRVTKTQRELFWNEGFNILNPNHESVAGMRSDSTNLNSKDAFMRGYNDARRSNTFSDKNPFGWTENRISRAIDYAMNKAPFLGDDYWMRRNYSKEMASMLDSKGYHAEIEDGNINLYDTNGDLVPEDTAVKVLTQLNADAVQRAKEDTYHDQNDLAQIVNEVARMNSFTKFAINGNQPFINTPMNITRRAIEYSPVGLIAQLKHLNDVKSGQISASTWLNNLAKGTTGASAMVLGAWLAKMGILRALGDDNDEKVQRYENAKGLQDYSLAIPWADGWSATLDWLAPGIAPFLLGATLFEEWSQYEPSKDSKTTLQQARDLAGETFKDLAVLFRPIADTTMLSGLMETLSMFGNEKTWAQDVLASTTQNYLRQLSPVLLSKIHGIIDPTKYSTSSDSWLDSQLRAAAINIRLIDYAMTAMNEGEQYLQPQIDLNGKPIQTQDYGLGAAGRAITNLINPATVKQDTRDSTDLELERLYKKQTGKKDYFLPSISASYNGIHFTPEERTEFNQYFLSNYKKAADEFIKSPMYNDYDDSERYKILYAMENHYYTEGQARYLGRVVPGADQILTERDKACDFANSLGLSTPKFYRYIYTEFDSTPDGEHINNTRAMKVRAQMEADGVWEEVKKAIDNGKYKPDTFNLNKLVTGWDTTDFTYYYNQMLNGQYDGKNKKKK